jgi:D-alanyl-D-alanine dipeptidase
MFGGGFKGISTEWWHFELPDAAGYPLLDDVFACLAPAKTDGVIP